MQFRECNHGQYYIKIYDKGLQYGLKHHILRVELKFIKMEKINSFGIKYLSDLLIPSKLEKLRAELLRVYDEILIGDLSVNTERLTEKDKVLFANGHNDNYWGTNLPLTKNFEQGSRDKGYRRKIRAYHREMNKFKDILRLTGATRRKVLIKELIESESSNLIYEMRNKLKELQKCLELTDNKIYDPELKMSQIDQLSESLKEKQPLLNKKDELSQIDYLFYSDNQLHKMNSSNRKCQVTGFDISMQKNDSRFLCVTGIKYYKKNYPEIWLKLWKRLSPKWYGCSEETQIREIHHSIRNEYFNKIHNTRRSIKKVLEEPALFNQLSLIHPYKLEVAGLIN